MPSLCPKYVTGSELALATQVFSVPVVRSAAESAPPAPGLPDKMTSSAASPNSSAAMAVAVLP